MVTLAAGLENVEFKLYNDVPYLDHSCWPTHLNIKRQFLDAILNSSAQSSLVRFLWYAEFEVNFEICLYQSQLIDMNGSLTDSLSLGGTSLVLNQEPASRKTSMSEMAQTTVSAAARAPARSRKSRILANNVSFNNEDSATSSTNNLSDYSSEYSTSTAQAAISSTAPSDARFYLPTRHSKSIGEKRNKIKNKSSSKHSSKSKLNFHFQLWVSNRSEQIEVTKTKKEENRGRKLTKRVATPTTTSIGLNRTAS